MTRKILIIILTLLMISAFTLPVCAGERSGYSNLPVARSAGRSIARFAVEHSRNYTSNNMQDLARNAGTTASTTVYYLRSGRTVIDTPNGTTVIGRGLFPQLRQGIIRAIAGFVLPNARNVNVNSSRASTIGMTLSGNGSTHTSDRAQAYMVSDYFRSQRQK